MDVRLRHAENALRPILVTPSGSMISERLLQLLKASVPIDVFPLISTAVRLWQPEKALPPIEVTVSGIAMEIKLLQPSNVRYSIVDTPFGIFIEVRL